MKAIVLSFDKYHPFVDHMIAAYDGLWPGHPFRFRVPYQTNTSLRDKYGDRIDLIQTGSSFNRTVLGLLEGIPDDEWVYWCIDDKYPVELDLSAVNGILSYVRVADDNVAGIMFCRPILMYLTDHVERRPSLVDPAGRKYCKRTTYGAIWVHQFIRAGVLRNFFAPMPDKKFPAKEMNQYQWNTPMPSGGLYILERSAAILGESTTRGVITRNCARSMVAHGIAVPDDFPISDKDMLIGHESYSLSELALRWQVTKKTGRRRLAKLGLGKLARRLGLR